MEAAVAGGHKHTHGRRPLCVKKGAWGWGVVGSSAWPTAGQGRTALGLASDCSGVGLRLLWGWPPTALGLASDCSGVGLPLVWLRVVGGGWGTQTQRTVGGLSVLASQEMGRLEVGGGLLCWACCWLGLGSTGVAYPLNRLGVLWVGLPLVDFSSCRWGLGSCSGGPGAPAREGLCSCSRGPVLLWVGPGAPVGGAWAPVGGAWGSCRWGLGLLSVGPGLLSVGPGAPVGGAWGSCRWGLGSSCT